MWAYGDARAPQTRSRIKRHKTKRLSLSCLNDFPNVDVKFPAHSSKFIGQSDIHISKRVFEKLHHLRSLRRRQRHYLFKKLLVQKSRQRSAARGYSAEDLRNIP